MSSLPLSRLGHEDRDQPPLKLRRSAEALAKAEVAKITKNYKLSVFVSIVVFELFVMGYRDSFVDPVTAPAVVRWRPV
jgi:hypothetical protein